MHYLPPAPVIDPAEASAFVFHDLKSPLMAILGTAEALLVRPHLTEDDVSALADIRDAAYVMRQMLSDLVDVHLADTGRLVAHTRHLDVGVLLRDTASSLRRLADLRGQRLLVVTSGDRPSVNADASLLKRVLSNIVANALKFNRPGGTIRLGAEVAANGKVRLHVEDEGPGVPPELRSVIFAGRSPHIERGEGRGLGLRFCQAVASLHGGRIWVEDAPLHGARFVVEL